MASYLIGIDSGTQSAKAVVVRMGDGKVMGGASKRHGLIEKLPPGHKEQHPQVWVDAVKSSVRAALRASKIEASKVLAVGVSGQQHGLAPLDQQGRVIRPAKLWCDTSTSAQSKEIVQRLGGLKEAVRLLGNGIPTGFTAPKILWLKQKEPKHYDRLATVLLPHDYLNFWLTGAKTMEYGDASGTGLFDVRKRHWRMEVIRVLGNELLDKLPQVQPSDRPVGRLSAEAARALGLSTNVMVSAGGGDNMMGAIGTGNTRRGIVTASFGTSGTIYAYSPSPVVDPEGEIAAFCDSTGAWMPLVCTMNVTVATEMVRARLGWTHELFSKRAASIPPGSRGLLLIPYLEGERTPDVPDGTGVLMGVTPRTFGPETFARAAMEGVTMGMNYGLNRLRALGIVPEQIRVTGGGAQSRVWRQIMADVFDCPVIGMKTVEGAAYGAALQAWWCYDLARGDRYPIHKLTDRCVKTDSRTAANPNPQCVKVYRSMQAIQDRAAKDMAAMFQLHREAATVERNRR